MNVSTSYEAMDEALTEMATLGLPIHITELDVNGAQGGQEGLARTSRTMPPPPRGWSRMRIGSLRMRMRESSAPLRSIVTRCPRHLLGCQRCGLLARPGKALLFDGDNQPKAAFRAVLTTVGAGERAEDPVNLPQNPSPGSDTHGHDAVPRRDGSSAQGLHHPGALRGTLSPPDPSAPDHEETPHPHPRIAMLAVASAAWLQAQTVGPNATNSPARRGSFRAPPAPRNPVPILPALPAADDKAFYATNDVPHGRVEVVEYPTSTGAVRRMHVYLPPGYDAEAGRRYPVLYPNHGGGENDSHWAAKGFAHCILDNLIAAGKARPMIVVMPNTGPLVSGRPPKLGEDDACTQEYLKGPPSQGGRTVPTRTNRGRAGRWPGFPWADS